MMHTERGRRLKDGESDVMTADLRGSRCESRGGARARDVGISLHVRVSALVVEHIFKYHASKGDIADD